MGIVDFNHEGSNISASLCISDARADEIIELMKKVDTVGVNKISVLLEGYLELANNIQEVAFISFIIGRSVKK